MLQGVSVMLTRITPQAVKEVLEEILGEASHDGTPIRDAGIDSLAIVELAFRLEDEHEYVIDEHIFDKISSELTVGELCTLFAR